MSKMMEGLGKLRLGCSHGPVWGRGGGQVIMEGTKFREESTWG